MLRVPARPLPHSTFFVFRRSVRTYFKSPFSLIFIPLTVPLAMVLDAQMFSFSLWVSLLPIAVPLIQFGRQLRIEMQSNAVVRRDLARWSSKECRLERLNVISSNLDNRIYEFNQNWRLYGSSSHFDNMLFDDTCIADKLGVIGAQLAENAEGLNIVFSDEDRAPEIEQELGPRPSADRFNKPRPRWLNDMPPERQREWDEEHRSHITRSYEAARQRATKLKSHLVRHRQQVLQAIEATQNLND